MIRFKTEKMLKKPFWPSATSPSKGEFLIPSFLKGGAGVGFVIHNAGLQWGRVWRPVEQDTSQK